MQGTGGENLLGGCWLVPTRPIVAGFNLPGDNAGSFKCKVDLWGIWNFRWVITDRKHGLLVSPHNPEKLAVALREVITQPERREFLAEQGHLLAKKRFGLKRFA
ncbi:hypothetical protein JYU10_00695, partial [bacterium AH-315-J04]|nr:hypothetical protein [bacterium AH-315-J04]